ncbi:MAG: ACT domain-containing protein [Ilumatobacteraceae bacterium]
MKSSPGIAAKMFRALSDEGVNIQMISTSTIRISVIMAAGDMERRPRPPHRLASTPAPTTPPPPGAQVADRHIGSGVGGDGEVRAVTVDHLTPG